MRAQKRAQIFYGQSTILSQYYFASFSRVWLKKKNGCIYWASLLIIAAFDDRRGLYAYCLPQFVIDGFLILPSFARRVVVVLGLPCLL